MKRLSALICILMTLAGPTAVAATTAGLKKLQAMDPLSRHPMDVVAFFPSPSPNSTTPVGSYQVAASRSTEIEDGRHPLILLSHGAMGSMWGHHDLATFLARQGHIVVSLTHPGDNFQDASRTGSTSALYGRPMQISAVLQAAFDDPALAPHIDRERVGFVGFSAGGATGLILAGARPDIARLPAYCAQRPEDRHVCHNQGRITAYRHDLAPQADARIQAFVLLAPLSVIFPPEELAQVHVPLLIYAGEQDEELSSTDNAIALAQALPQPVLKTFPAAGHFAFLAPCSMQMREAMPGLCIDPPGLDRAALHQELNREIAVFFDTMLAQPRD